MRKKVLMAALAIILLTVIAILHFNTDFLKPKIKEEKKIYATQSAEASWAYPVGEIDYIIESSEYILKVEIMEKEPSFFEKKDMFPRTPIKVRVIEVLKGDTTKKEMTIYQTGGIVTLKQVIEYTSEDRVNKMGLDKVAEEDLENQYMVYEFAGHHNLEEGKEYVVCISSNNLFANGFTIFEITEDGYKNPITKNLLTTDDLNK